MPTIAVPDKWKVPKSIRDELPAQERDGAAQSLWDRSGGVCAICNEPLPVDGKNVDVDHKVARGEAVGGETKLKNLYLAHRACNRSRQNLPFTLATQVIRFSKWCQAAPRRSFKDVVSHYVPKGNQRAVVSARTDTEITLRFGALERRAPVAIDPATKTPYFFMDVPIEYIQNDEESQPRYIEHDHVRKLAVDFSVHPVHEPSNCRLVPSGPGGLMDLLQFDGQHKTTAQIVLRRSEIPMKFYYDPSEPMIQELVVQIQQGIKKRPLSTTDTLRKLDDVVKDKVEEFQKEHGRFPTEAELVASQPKQEQRTFRARLLSNFEFAILSDDRFLLQKYVSKKSSRSYPLTDTVLLKRMIHPLVSQELLSEPLDASVMRETEREAIITLLNRFADTMLGDHWDPKTTNDAEDLHTRRARNFFYQAAIGWWLGDIFITSLGLIIPRARWKRLFVEPLTLDQEDRIEAFVETLCSWDIWSTQDANQLAALRSNTVTNVVQAFPSYDHTRLIKEAQEA